MANKSSANQEKRNPWLDAAVALQYLQQKFSDMEFPVPRYAICGMQSAGKTRMLSVFAGRKIGGAEKAATGTRCPVIYRFQMADGPELFQIGKDARKMHDIAPENIDEFITNHMDELGEQEKKGKTGFSNDPIYVDLAGKNCLNAVLVDLPGVKPVCKEYEQMNKVITAMIQKQVTELKAIPLVMSGFKDNMDMQFVKADLETVLRNCVRPGASYAATAKRAILIVSRLDMVRQALMSYPEKLEEFQQMAEQVGFDRKNMIFLTLVPEALDGMSRPICDKETTYDVFENYFQNTFPEMEDKYYPDILERLDPNNERKFRVTALRQVIEGTLEGDMRVGFQAALDQMRQLSSKLASEIETLQKDESDGSVKIHARAYVELMNDIIHATKHCNIGAIENALAISANRFPSKIGRTDLSFCRELVSSMSRDFESEYAAIMDQMPDITADLHILNDPELVKKLEENAPEKDHALVTNRKLKLYGSASVRRLVSLFGFSVVTRASDCNFTLEDVLNMAGMSADIRGPFPVNSVLHKMVKQLSINSKAVQSIIYWSFWLYSCQVDVVIEALRDKILLLDDYPKLQECLDGIFLEKYISWLQSKAAKAVLKVEEQMRLRFGALKLDELYGVIRLLGCSNLTSAIFIGEGDAIENAPPAGHWKKVYRAIEKAAEKDSKKARKEADAKVDANKKARAISGVLDLLKATIDNPEDNIGHTFKYISKSLPNCPHDLATLEGFQLKEINYRQVGNYLANLNSTGQMLATFQSGQAYLDLVGIVESLVIEETHKLHEVMFAEMGSVVDALFENPKFGQLLRHLNGANEADRQMYNQCQELNERTKSFLEAAARLNSCCDQIGVRKLEIDSLKSLSARLEQRVNTMTDNGLGREDSDDIDYDEMFEREINWLKEVGIAPNEHEIIISRLSKRVMDLEAENRGMATSNESEVNALREKLQALEQQIADVEQAKVVTEEDSGTGNDAEPVKSTSNKERPKKKSPWSLSAGQKGSRYSQKLIQ